MPQPPSGYFDFIHAYIFPANILA